MFKWRICGQTFLLPWFCFVFPANHGCPKVTTPLIEFLTKRKEEKRNAFMVIMYLFIYSDCFGVGNLHSFQTFQFFVLLMYLLLVGSNINNNNNNNCS